MNHIEIYTKNWCPYCHAAKALLNHASLAFDEIDVTDDATREAEMIGRSKRRTVPQIFIGGVHVGGFDDLQALQVDGELSPMVVGQPVEV